MSKLIIFERNASTNPVYYIVLKNVVCKHILTKDEQTLFMGSLVVSEPEEDIIGFVRVKIIDAENRYSSKDDEFLCPLKSHILLPLSEEVWNLIVAVSSPEERIRIAQDEKLCQELCHIDKGTVVEVLSSGSRGVVIGKGTLPELRLGTHFKVELLDSQNCNYYSVNELKLKNTVYSKNFSLKNNCGWAENSLYKISDDKKSENRSNGKYAAFMKSSESKFKPLDKVVWTSETGEQVGGTVCWLTSSDTSIRIHLGKSECKAASCERAYSRSIPVCQLMTEQEYISRKKKNSSPQENRRSNDTRVHDFIGLDQEDYSYKNYFGSTVEDNDKDKRSLKSEEYLPHNLRKCEPTELTNETSNSDELGVGSMVEVMLGDEPHYGVIRWLGTDIYGPHTPKIKVAGIEMEEENADFSDGYLHKRKLFDCAPHRGYFTFLSRCTKDSRFQDTGYACMDDTKTPDDFGSAVISGIVEPIEPTENMHWLYGKYKGIQGHNNSCYLDATLFSMFSFTSVFDNLLYRPANNADISEYEEVQRVLREEIVNPLRKNHFVRADRVMNLRTLLDNLTSVTGLTCEEKDPEEFLTSLVAQVLKAEPFLKLSSGHEAYYYQLFVEKDERLKLPTVQQLFEQSFITSDIKLKEVPSCLIIQMPRFGKIYKMYPRILPSQVLDVTDVIENSPRQCSVCGGLAKFECKECFRDNDQLQCFSFCESCARTIHNHEARISHKYTTISVPSEFKMTNHSNTMSRHFMELFAVLCIETSHYVAFVKCGVGPDTPWCFFDSMADRKGGWKGFNIPEMVLCSELPDWLSESGAQTFSEIKDDRHLPPYAKRLMCDAYMCMYQSTDVMMYR